MQFSEILFDLRSEKNATQKEVAQACGITPTCICQLESGARNPTGSTIRALSRYFNVSADYLLGLSDDLGNVIPNAFELTDAEKKHLTNLRRLKPQTQQYIFGLVENLALSG